MIALLVLLQVCPGGGECVPMHPSPPPPGPATSISYTMFIPLDHVRLPFGVSDFFYEADNQATYQQAVSTYRIHQSVTVSTGSGIISQGKDSALSRIYDSEATPANLTTSGSCYRKNCPSCPSYPAPFFTSITFENQCMIRTAEPDQPAALAEGMETITATLVEANHSSENTNHVKIRIQGSPTVGVAPYSWASIAAPSIDWDITIRLTYNSANQTTSYEIEGEHDGFPFHVMHIGSQQVYERDPIPNGDTPVELSGTMDVDFTRNGSL